MNLVSPSLQHIQVCLSVCLTLSTPPPTPPSKACLTPAYSPQAKTFNTSQLRMPASFAISETPPLWLSPSVSRLAIPPYQPPQYFCRFLVCLSFSVPGGALGLRNLDPTAPLHGRTPNQSYFGTKTKTATQGNLCTPGAQRHSQKCPGP